MINGTDGAAFSVNKLKVGFSTVGKFGKLVSSDIQKRNDWGTDTRESGNAFDGDMTTVIKFAGQPRQGNTAVFDLGQPIDITSLRIYTQDTQYDYIRDTKVQMSVDGKTWVDAFEIGDGVSDTDTTTAFGDISDTNKKTDSNYPNVFYYGKDDIANGTGMRYLRLLTTADYPQRALAFNEFMVNQRLRLHRGERGVLCHQGRGARPRAEQHDRRRPDHHVQAECGQWLPDLQDR